MENTQMNLLWTTVSYEANYYILKEKPMLCFALICCLYTPVGQSVDVDATVSGYGTYLRWTKPARSPHIHHSMPHPNIFLDRASLQFSFMFFNLFSRYKLPWSFIHTFIHLRIWINATNLDSPLYIIHTVTHCNRSKS